MSHPLQRRKSFFGFLIVGLSCLGSLLLAGQPAPENQPERQPPHRDLSSYREFLVQAERFLGEKDGADKALKVLDFCPKDLRHFEWHYLHAKAHQRGSAFRGHRWNVCCVAFSPDGRTMASGSDDESIKLWDVATRNVRQTLKGHDGSVRCLAYHPKGKILASGGEDREVKLWNTVTGKNYVSYEIHKESVHSLAFTPDGALLASASEDGVHVLDLASLMTYSQWQDPAGDVGCLTISSDGKQFASGSTGRSISVRSVPDFRLTRTLWHEAKVTDLAFHPDGKRLISTGLDGLRIWNIADGNQLQSNTDRDETPLWSLASNRIGTTIVTIGGKGKVKFWHEPFAQPGGTLDVLQDEGKSYIAFHPNGHSVVFEKPWARSVIATYDVEESVMIRAAEPIWSVNPGKTALLVSLRKGAAALSVSGKEQEGLQGHRGQVRAIVVHPQGHLLASAGHDRLVKIWDSRGLVEHYSLKGHGALIRGLAFSPDGRHLASASEDKTIKIWDVVAGAEVRTLRGHQRIVTSVVYLPKGDRLLSAGGDGTIRLWDVATGQIRETWAAHDDIVSHIALSPDGTRLASAGTDHKIKIWDVAKAKPIHTLKAPTGLVQSLAFSPDGKRLASGIMGGGVTLWDPDHGQAVYTFARSAGPVNAVAFSPDGLTLYSGSYDGTVMMWKARPID